VKNYLDFPAYCVVYYARYYATSIDAVDLLDSSAGLRQIGTGYAGIAAIDPIYAAHWNPANIVYAENMVSPYL